MPPQRITIFGSSSIYGTADSQLGGFVNRFRLWYETIDARNRVYNLGIWGEQTSSLVERISREASVRKPHLIMIYPGFNDCRRHGSRDSPNIVSKGSFRDSMLKLISNAQAIAETVVITGYPFDESRTCPLPSTNCYYLLSDAAEYTKTLVSASHELGAQVLDFFTALYDRDMDPLLAPDGLHGNTKCHELLFNLTRDFFQDSFD